MSNHTVGSILCCYVNRTNLPQVGWLANLPSWQFERLILPGESILFTTDAEARLELHAVTTKTALHVEQIPCQLLSIGEDIVNQLLAYVS
jgi:hypothetical protein